MKKKILALCLVVVLAITAVTGATLAYFTDTDDATNTFTVGNVDIDLTEPKWDTDGSGDAPDVYPGEALDKNPIVTNIGENPCFVRVHVSNLDQFGDKGMIEVETNSVKGALGDGWVKIGDYYYYNKPIVPASQLDNGYNDGLTVATTELFHQIVMPTGLTGDEEAQPVVVTAQAVQAQGARDSWSAVKAMTAEEIAAWFETVMAAEA